MTGEEPATRGVSRSQVLLTVCGALALSLPNFAYPYFEDTALFAAFGRWMHEGLLPYRDLIDQKPPGIYWLAFLTNSLFGTSPLGARAVETFAILALALGCGRIVASVLPAARSWAVLIAAAFCSGSFWRLPERGQVEFFEAAAMTWSVAFALACLDRDSSRNAFLSGAAVGLAAWFKPQAILLCVPLWIAPLIAVSRPAPFRFALNRGLLLAAGALAASGPFLAWLAWTGSLAPFLDLYQYVQRGYLALAPTLSFSRVISDLRLPTTTPTTAILILATATVGLARITQGSSCRRMGLARATLLGGWLLAGFAQFLSGRFLFHYHKIVMVPALATLVAIGSWWLVSHLVSKPRRRSTRITRIALPGAFFLVFLFLATTPKILVDAVALFRWAVVQEEDSLWCRYGRYGHYYDYCAQSRAAELARDQSPPQGHTQVIMLGGTYYLYSGLLPATRYPIAFVALDSRAPGHTHRLQEFLADLRHNRPTFIMVRTTDYFPWFGAPAGVAMLRQRPDLQDLLGERYRFEGEIAAGFLAFRLASAGKPTSAPGPIASPLPDGR